MDPVELRLKNALTPEKPLTTGAPIPGGVGITEVIQEVARAAGWSVDADMRWRRPPKPVSDGTVRRGIGLAAGFQECRFQLWLSGQLLGAHRTERAADHR